MKARGFLTKASKLSEKGMSKFLPLVVMAGAFAVLNAGSVNADTIVENTVHNASSQLAQSVHVAYTHMIPR